MVCFPMEGRNGRQMLEELCSSKEVPLKVLQFKAHLTSN